MLANATPKGLESELMEVIRKAYQPRQDKGSARLSPLSGLPTGNLGQQRSLGRVRLFSSFPSDPELHSLSRHHERSCRDSLVISSQIIDELDGLLVRCVCVCVWGGPPLALVNLFFSMRM